MEMFSVNNFMTRVLLGLVGIPVFLFFLWKGGIFLLGLLGVMVLVGSLELIKMVAQKGVNIPKVFVLFNLLIFLSFSCSYYYFMALFFLGLFVCLGVYNLTQELQGGINRIATGVFAAIYLAMFLGCAYKIWEVDGLLLIAVLVMVWVTDTFAYLVGMVLGKHRGLVKASPKKSLEGFLGGFGFCVLTGYIFCLFFNQIEPNFFLLTAFLVGIFAQLGDIFASSFKRDCGVKDSGTILPGHGGVIDRFDSLLLVAPVVYLFASWYYDLGW